ncbi:class I tRNA ligase family protein [Candidatus Mycoplasma mahonii]|uniref:class I tRNA ligase family protein n=1 Tax=Candidatus Mycoplasma mahonii TaxID=3004105 RepID=UPI0035712D10
MFMGPFEETKPWQEDGVKGIRKWLERVVRAFDEVAIIGKSKLNSEFNLFIKEVTIDIEDLKFNVAISKMMIFINVLHKVKHISAHQRKSFLIVLSLFAPHIVEELLQKFKEQEIAKQIWPTFDEALIKEEIIEIAIQVNGKLRGTLQIKGNESKEEIFTLVKNMKSIQKHLTKNIIKEIYIPHKIVNIVVK